MTDTPRILVASLEARTAALEKGLNRANDKLNRSWSQIEGRTQNARRRIESETATLAQKANANLARIGVGLKPIALGLAPGAAGILGGLSVAGVVGEIRDATKSMAELSAEAKRAGVGVEAFQALGYAARQNAVSVDALVDGMKELQLRADEFIVTGKGSGAESFQRLGYRADELKAKLKNPSELLIEIIGRLQRLGDTAAQIRIADEVFGGTGGEQFVRFLEQGEAGLRRNMEEAKRLGVVLDADVVAKGVELDKQFQRIADTVSGNVKRAVVGVATAIADWTTNAERFLNSLGNSAFFKTLNDWMSFDWSKTGDVKLLNPADQPSAEQKLRIEGLDRLREALQAAGRAARANVPDRAQHLPSTFVDQKLAGLQTDFRASLAGFILAAREAGHDIKIQSGFRSVERQQELWAAAVAKYGSEEAARKWVAPPGKSYHNKGTAADLNYAGGGMSGSSAEANAARQWAHQNAVRFGLQFPLGNEAWHVEPAGQRGAGAMGDPDTSSLERQTQKRTEAQLAADKQAESVKRVMEALGLETAQIGQTEQQQRILQELSRAGVDIHSAEGQKIAAKVADLYRLKAAQDRLTQSTEAANRAREEIRDFGADTTKGIISDLRSGVSAAEAFGNALNRIADKLISMAVDQIFAKAFAAPTGGGGGGGFGFLSLIGGLFGFAEGGAVSGPGTGTSDSILARLSDGEFVVNAKQSAKYGPVLQAINNDRLPKFARGGAVGSLPAILPALAAPALPSAQAALGGTSNQTINFAPQITVNGSAGTPEQNSDLARQISREMEATMRGVASDEIRRQTRPGNLLSRGR